MTSNDGVPKYHRSATPGCLCDAANLSTEKSTFLASDFYLTLFLLYYGTIAVQVLLVLFFFLVSFGSKTKPAKLCPFSDFD